MSAGPVVVLAGGTGGAKLARGMLDLAAGELVVIANTADDIEIHGGHVSPDPDLVSFWLADRIDERGWGLEGDSFRVMDELAALGADPWFRLGDGDLAWCLERRRLIDGGARPTQAHETLTRALGLRARVLPMSDDPVRTRVLARGSWHPFQEFMIRERAAGPVDGVVFDGIEAARPSAEVLDALARARAIVIGPSNPVISIGPILEVPGLAEAIRASAAPVVAVSPLVAGRVLKGPTAAFMQWAGLTLDAAGIARAYAGLADGLLSDEPGELERVELRCIDVGLGTPQDRRSVAQATLDFALELKRSS